jgi:hypothetical protein
MLMQETIYQIHGLDLRLTTDSPVIGAAAQTLLRRFPQEPVDGAAALELRFQAVRQRSEIPSLPELIHPLLAREEVYAASSRTAVSV